MKEFEKDTDWIDAYLDKKMNAEEQKVFKKRLREDDDFKNQVTFQHDLRQATKLLRREELNDFLNKVAAEHKSAEKGKNNKPDEPIGWFGNGKILRFAASIALLCVVASAIFYFVNSQQENRMAESSSFQIQEYLNEQNISPQFVVRRVVIDPEGKQGFGFASADTLNVALTVIKGTEYNNHYYMTNDTLYLFGELKEIELVSISRDEVTNINILLNSEEQALLQTDSITRLK